MDLNPGTVIKTYDWDRFEHFPLYKDQVGQVHFIYKALISVICHFKQ